jgi:general stress protein 26
MTAVMESERESFFADVDAASRKATWCAVATVDKGVPKVRLVHPTWEGDVLWFATSRSSPKAVQLAANPAIDVQFQVSPPEFIHILVSGTAELLDDTATREHVWEVMDYDLADFWPDGPGAEDFVAVKITPQRVELSEMFGMNNKRVWRA